MPGILIGLSGRFTRAKSSMRFLNVFGNANIAAFLQSLQICQMRNFEVTRAPVFTLFIDKDINIIEKQ